jgi:hypothetical protein
VYKKYMEQRWTVARVEGEDEELDKKLSWVPKMVIKSFADASPDIRIRVVQLVDEVLVPKSAKEDVRAAALETMWRSLDADAREGLRRLLEHRAKCRQGVVDLLEARQARRRGDEDSVDRIKALCHQLGQRILHSDPPTSESGAETKLLELMETRDNRVFTQLTRLVDPARNTAEQRKTREDVLQRLDTKSDLAIVVKKLLRSAIPWIASQATMSALLSRLASSLDELEEGDDEDAVGICSGLELMLTFAAHLPGLLRHLFPNLLKFAACSNAAVSVLTMRIIAVTAPDAELSGRLVKTFMSQLLPVCLKGTPEQGKASLIALLSLRKPSTRFFGELVETLTTDDRLSYKNAKLETVLRALSVVALRVPRVFDRRADVIVSFVKEQVVLVDSSPESGPRKTDEHGTFTYTDR